MIKIKTCENGTINVYTPYNKDFVKAIKGIGKAKWTGSAWNIPANAIDVARKAMKECYGETDIPDSTKRLTVRITFTDDAYADRSGYAAFGQTLAVAYGRDTGAKIGDSVIMESGKVDSCGSVKNWRTYIEKGSIFRLTVPECLYNSTQPDAEWTAEILPESTISHKAALIAEKEKILARLAEIEKELEMEDSHND